MDENLRKRGWKEAQLKDISQIIGGGTPSRKKPEYWNGEIPWLTTSDLSGYPYKKIKRGKENITKLGLDNSSAKLLPKGSIIYSSRASIGYIAIAYNPIATSQGFRNLVPNEKKVKKDYLYYALKYYTPLIERIASGATYKEISGSELKRIKINLPPLSEQHKISLLLSNLDDQIKNNIKRINILENISNLIYDDWFLHFNYPGYENDKIIETDFGPKPKEWYWEKLGEVINLEYGKGLRKSDRVPGKFPVYGSSGIIDYHNDYFVEGPCIIVGRKGNVGSIYWSQENCNPIDTVYYVESNESLYYLFYHLLNQRFIDSHAAVPGLNRDYAYSLPLLVPKKDVLDKFDSIIKPIFEYIHLLEEKNEILMEIKKVLLPNLISGELDISELDIEV